MTDQSHDLFGAVPVEPARPPCFMTLAARRKLGQGEDWHWCNAEALAGTDILLEGGIPPLFTKGKRQGRPNWQGVPLTKLVVTRSDIDAEKRIYEDATGSCSNCAGSGQELAGWHHEKGSSYRTCITCLGTGKPAEVSP